MRHNATRVSVFDVCRPVKIALHVFRRLIAARHGVTQLSRKASFRASEIYLHLAIMHSAALSDLAIAIAIATICNLLVSVEQK